jgi:hypothetical protein
MKKLVAVGLAALIAACAGEAPPPESPASVVGRRAADDLQCPATDVHTKTLDDRTRKAWGCGRAATYVESCEACGSTGHVGPFGVVETTNDRCNCTWMLNSPVQTE